MPPHTPPLPTGSPLLMTTMGLSHLTLLDILLSSYFHPTYLLTQLFPMPQES